MLLNHIVDSSIRSSLPIIYILFTRPLTFILIIQAYPIQQLVFPLTSLLLIYLLLQLPDLRSD